MSSEASSRLVLRSGLAAKEEASGLAKEDTRPSKIAARDRLKGAALNDSFAFTNCVLRRPASASSVNFPSAHGLLTSQGALSCEAARLHPPKRESSNQALHWRHCGYHGTI